MIKAVPIKQNMLTPLTIFVPTLVTNPLTLSDLEDETTSVDPGSLGASKAIHSSNPFLSEAKDSCNELSRH